MGQKDNFFCSFSAPSLPSPPFETESHFMDGPKIVLGQKEIFEEKTSSLGYCKCATSSFKNKSERNALDKAGPFR